MFKKSLAVLTAGLFIVASVFVTTSSAATIKNGVACTKTGAVSTVKVGSSSKSYICKINPAIAGATKTTWTLKTCITYWSAALGSQKLIDDQRSLVQVMTEPDKTTYNKQLDASQAQLDKVKAAIVENHCKLGL